jgi:uncharacterized cupredoxin-like copper-binding protein
MINKRLVGTIAAGALGLGIVAGTAGTIVARDPATPSAVDLTAHMSQMGSMMTGRYGMMSGGSGMMSGRSGFGPASVQPGSSGFVAGTVAAPRVVRVIAGPNLRFYPDVVRIVAGETITFEVTTMGLTTHEFMIGPAVAVAADTEGTPEVADIGMMQTKSVTYTFTGTGPFAFACHAPGHFEAGMSGTIAIVP